MRMMGGWNGEEWYYWKGVEWYGQTGFYIRAIKGDFLARCDHDTSLSMWDVLISMVDTVTHLCTAVSLCVCQWHDWLKVLWR